MDTRECAEHWNAAWEKHWPAGTLQEVAELYADEASYRALAFHDAAIGRTAIEEQFRAWTGDESEVTCAFNDPVVDGSRAVCEWWAAWVEGGERQTMVGTTMLEFDEHGLVIDHRDYWNQTAGDVPAYPDWARRG